MATRITIDAHVIDALMPDLVGHDRQPSAFLVYLYLYRHGGAPRGRPLRASLQQIASDTGLSKSAVQHALRTLKRRRLVHARSVSATTAPDYEVRMPWLRTAAER
jgi:DNA-binding transcriptional ArsR family regulator